MNPDEVYTLLAFGSMSLVVGLVYCLMAWILGKITEQGVLTR